MFYPQRVVDMPDGLPKWTGINQQSDLMADTDAEVVREYERKRQKQRDEENNVNMPKEEEKK